MPTAGTLSRALAWLGLGLAATGLFGAVARKTIGARRLGQEPPASQGNSSTPHHPADRHATLTVKGTPEQIRDRWHEYESASEVADRINSARFVATSGGRGTEIHLTLRAETPLRPLAAVGAKLAALRGRAPKQQAMDALRTFKQLVETGHVTHSEATIHGHPHPGRPPERLPSRSQPGIGQQPRPARPPTQPPYDTPARSAA